MKRNILKIIPAVAAAIVIIPLCGCNDIEENYCPELLDVMEDQIMRTDEFYEKPVTPPASPAVQTVDRLAEVSQAQSGGGVPDAEYYSDINGGKLSFTVGNVFSQGEYYSVSVAGEKSGDQKAVPDDFTTYINGELYGDFRLILTKDGAELDSIPIGVPNDDKFLIMESVIEDISYGCELISNMREFSANDYPDIIQLDFYKVNESEIPQYARYFAIFDGQLAELPIYENGIEQEPCGTHLELRGVGRSVQHLCVYTPSGKSLMVAKYEYIFNLEQRRLDKREVDFLGWNVDNR